MRVSEDEALASDEHRAELTPFFWQGVAGGFGALVVTGLVFAILSFSQVTQTLTALKNLASFTDPLKVTRVCKPTKNLE